ncbi:hypothetical protein SERLADRAFT_416412 [Serpula lacrymans var. lacrymans S7.9]|uniref:FAD-binding PCMH-type domain-containing protein n=1 Tax=Serpula lacrymans var. lacrymans (strain S7.9) TaxID=578457 RepID=F8P0W4_SERL9|nr:uncharacterized protein SERLADRAFT_416412 [Serpula lacrymans var. lacrymans S7.9]EGO22798.1 hypothetical protein SERLADRAFT_416412 [Serpula lacrymans var. lacrymans S7.9]
MFRLVLALSWLRLVSSSSWSALNDSLDGSLFSARPLALPCFSSFNNTPVHPDPSACALLQQNYSNATYKSSLYPNTMQPEWGTCMTTHSQCLLDYTDPTNPLAFLDASCDQGSISPYYIDVRSPQDVLTAFSFANATGIPLSIKNSGHDYKGRSNIPSSLALWMTYNASFVPEGCPSSQSYNTITTGAGNNFQDLYAFADQNNVTLIGGYAQTVGASGGWVMGGGHSVLSPVYGLGIDRVLQFLVVTPSGLTLTANSCQNTDLFWALRGGGGGTFGVVLESTHRVEGRLSMQVASLSMNATSTNMRAYYEILVNNSMQWASEGWGGHIVDSAINYVTPLLSLAEAQASMEPIASYVTSQGGSVVIETMDSWYDYFEKYVVPTQESVARLLAIGSRLMPQSVFISPTLSSQLVDLLLTFPLVYIPVVGPVLYNETAANETSATPAWRDSLWHVNTGLMWYFNTSTADVNANFGLVHNYTLAMTEIAPDSGAYLNEGDVYQSDHETAFWGDNYSELLSIKQKYDPWGLLDCWQCVGWKGHSNKDFECYFPSP